MPSVLRGTMGRQCWVHRGPRQCWAAHPLVKPQGQSCGCCSSVPAAATACFQSVTPASLTRPALTPTAPRCVLNVCQAGNELLCAGYTLYSSSTILVLTVGEQQ